MEREVFAQRRKKQGTCSRSGQRKEKKFLPNLETSFKEDGWIKDGLENFPWLLLKSVTLSLNTGMFSVQQRRRKELSCATLILKRSLRLKFLFIYVVSLQGITNG